MGACSRYLSSLDHEAACMAPRALAVIVAGWVRGARRRCCRRGRRQSSTVCRRSSAISCLSARFTGVRCSSRCALAAPAFAAAAATVAAAALTPRAMRRGRSSGWCCSQAPRRHSSPWPPSGSASGRHRMRCGSRRAFPRERAPAVVALTRNYEYAPARPFHIPCPGPDHLCGGVAVPGAGHPWLGRAQKGASLLVLLTVMFAFGLWIEGRLFPVRIRRSPGGPSGARRPGRRTPVFLAKRSAPASARRGRDLRAWEHLRDRGRAAEHAGGAGRLRHLPGRK